MIRAATEADLEAINAIYNHYVLHSTATFATEPMTDRERASWFTRHQPGHPVLVACRDAEVLGWACLSPYSDRAAYRHTVEDSVYVRAEEQGHGLGRSLLEAVLADGQRRGFRQVIAKIEASQKASLRLHHAVGFTTRGRFEQVGHKFDRWLDTELLQRAL